MESLLVGNNSVLKNCDIENSIVMNDCKITSKVNITDSIIADGCQVNDNLQPKKHQFLLGERSEIKI